MNRESLATNSLLSKMEDEVEMPKTTLSCLAIANYFLSLADREKKPLTNKKLQKLLYYAQAWSLALRNRPIFKESIEAWIHGPVIPKAYHHYKKFGFGAIRDNTNDIDPSSNEYKDILDEVWRIYGKYDADYLEILTHNEDPWLLARNRAETGKTLDNVISHDSMRSFYTSLLQKHVQKT